MTNNAIPDWSAAGTLEAGDSILINRPTAEPQEMLAPIAAFDARYLPAVAGAANNQLFGTDNSGHATPVAPGAGLVLAGGTLAANAGELPGLAVAGALDTAASIVVVSGGVSKLLPLVYLQGYSTADPPYLDSFGAPSGSDWTNVLQAAIASGTPFRLKPQTYLVEGDVATGTIASLMIRGWPGLSVIRRPTANASSENYANIQAASVDIDGVVFDMGGNGSSGWGVGFWSVTTLRVRRSCFRNAGTGGFGTGCIVSADNAEADGITTLFDDVEVTGCAMSGLWIEHAASADLRMLRAHGNAGPGMQAQRFSGHTGEPIRRIVVSGSHFFGNGGAGMSLGQYSETQGGSQVAGPDQPDVSEALVEGCYAWGNTGYGFALQAERLRLFGCQADANGSLGNILVNGRYVDIEECTSTGTGMGIDTGGSRSVRVRNTRIADVSGFGLNPGGCLDIETDGLLITGCAGAISLYANEESGQGDFFPFLARTARFRNTRIDVSDTVLGSVIAPILLRDGAQDVVFDGLDVVSNASTQNPTPLTAAQLIDVAGEVIVRNFRFNGARRVTLAAADGVLTVPDAAGEVIVSGTPAITSIVTQAMANRAGKVAYLAFSLPGAALTACTAAISGDGTGAAFTVGLWNGLAVGGRLTAAGSGYTAATVAFTVNDGGTAPVATCQVGLPLPAEWRLRLILPGGGTVLGASVAAGGVIDLTELSGSLVIAGAS